MHLPFMYSVSRWVSELGLMLVESPSLFHNIREVAVPAAKCYSNEPFAL
jgi:hypothetical protein